MDCHAKIAGFPTGEIEDHLQKSRATFLWPDNVTPRSDYVLKQAQVSKYIPILPGLPHQFARRNHQNQLKQTIKPRSHFFPHREGSTPPAPAARCRAAHAAAPAPAPRPAPGWSPGSGAAAPPGQWGTGRSRCRRGRAQDVSGCNDLQWGFHQWNMSEATNMGIYSGMMLAYGTRNGPCRRLPESSRFRK